MGILAFVFGMILFVPVLFFITLSAVSIIFADSLIVAIICAILTGVYLHVHPVICILIGFIVMAGVTFLYLKEKGSLILTIVSTASWMYLAGFFTRELGGDLLWSIFAAAITAVIIWLLHMKARTMIGIS